MEVFMFTALSILAFGLRAVQIGRVLLRPKHAPLQ
jgi:hypothetical protein